MHVRAFLEEISGFQGVSGHEYAYAQSVQKALQTYCDKVHTDNLGNVIGVRASNRPNAPKIMLAAHMDEIGLMVKKIDDKGFIAFTNIGGIDPRILLAQEVTVHGKEDLYGIIGAKPPHLQDKSESDKAVKMEDMAIDVGLSENQLRKVVSVGDVITFKATPVSLYNDYIASKALDDRAGIAVILECLKELDNTDIPFDLYAVATVQEEVGLRGAVVSSYAINPDIGIVIDVCHGDTPDGPKEEAYQTGKGAVITIGPNIHPQLVAKLKQVAKEYHVPYQIDVEPGRTGTDAWAIQVSRSGIPTLLLSFPLRYMHTTIETLCYHDVVSTGKLLAFFIKTLDQDLEAVLLC